MSTANEHLLPPKAHYGSGNVLLGVQVMATSSELDYDLAGACRVHQIKVFAWCPRVTAVNQT